MPLPRVMLRTAIRSLGRIKAASVYFVVAFSLSSRLSNTGVVAASTNLRPRELDSPRVREWSR